MREPPPLEEARLLAALRDGYGLPVAGLDFLPVGNDSSAWAYHVQTQHGPSYFLKVRRGALSPAGVAIPRYLKDHGLRQVVACLPTRTGELYCSVGDYGLLLYPLIEGTNGMQGGLSARQWIEYGAFVKALHASRLPARLLGQLPRETFKPPWSGVVREIATRIAAGRYDPQCAIECELAEFWRQREAEISRLVERAEDLGRRLQNRSLELVLCHADIHTANLLIDKDGSLFAVDWDGLLLAPKERDLMFVVEATIGSLAIGSENEALFFQGYGETDIDWQALAYYRYEWVVQDIGDYGERVFLMPGVGDETRADARQGFLELFEPGNVVDTAHRSRLV
jgi:spectinomycin phosphotransferase